MMDQTEYIKTFKPISHPELVGAPADAETATAVRAEYMSLLGAVALALLTQMWIAVYAVALRRNTKNSTNKTKQTEISPMHSHCGPQRYAS